MTNSDELGLPVGEEVSAAETDTTSTRAALAVYQQYQALSGDVNRFQKERLAVEDATAQLRAQIERLAEERGHMEARTLAAREEGDLWRQRLRAAHDKVATSSSSSGEAPPEASDVWVRRQAADLRLRVQERQSILRERREQFQRESRDFRLRGCREASVRAATVGLPRAVATHAYLALHGRFDFEARYMSGDAAKATEVQDENSPSDQALSEGDDPSLWTDLFTGDEAKDREVRELLQSYEAVKRQSEQAQSDRDQATERARAAREKLERRHDRRDAVHAQLERVNQEVVDLEAQVRALRCRTEEAVAGIGSSDHHGKRACSPTFCLGCMYPVSKIFTNQTYMLGMIVSDTGSAPPAAKRARFPTTTTFVSPSPPLQRAAAVVNPYARGAVPPRPAATTTTTRDESTAAPTLPPGASDARRRSDVQTAVLGVRRPSGNSGGQRSDRSDDVSGKHRPSRHPPHPRRHGRNREFGCSLVVEDGTDLDASWGARPPSPKTDETDDDQEEEPAQVPARSSLAQTLRLLEDDDEEDDSWLFADPWANKT